MSAHPTLPFTAASPACESTQPSTLLYVAFCCMSSNPTLPDSESGQSGFILGGKEGSHRKDVSSYLHTNTSLACHYRQPPHGTACAFHSQLFVNSPFNMNRQGFLKHLRKFSNMKERWQEGGREKNQTRENRVKPENKTQPQKNCH